MILKDYFTIFIPSLALCIALYTFLSNNPKFREFSPKFWIIVFVQLIAVFSCALRLCTKRLSTMGAMKIIDKIDFFLEWFSILAFLLSWLILIKLFYIIYGSLYHLRKKRFLKYTKLFGKIYEKFFHNKFYEENYRKRNSIQTALIKKLPDETIENLKNGGVILVVYDDLLDIDRYIIEFITDTIVKDKETVDYVVTHKSPVNICQNIPEDFIDSIPKKLSIIDCFSSFYSYDDKILRFRREDFTRKGYKFFPASSFAEIHTAANSSWYRFRKNCESEENQFRIPHRTIYDTLSSLIRYSSEEQYFSFFRHVISSEKSYGMITLILEPSSLEHKFLSELKRMCDVYLEYK